MKIIKEKMKKYIIKTITILLLSLMIEIPSFAENRAGNTLIKSSTNSSTTKQNNNSSISYNATNQSNNSSTSYNTTNKNNNSSISYNAINQSNNSSTSYNTINKNNNSSTSNNVTNQNNNSSITNSTDLSNLGITPYDFSGFSENKTEYEVTVPNSVSEVKIYATKKNINSTVTGTGVVKLQEGENIEKVVVTAPNGSKKTYTITIKRLKIGENPTTSTDSKKSDLALEKLEIKGFNLEPSYSKDIYQYTINFEGSNNDFDIIAEPNKSNAKVKIIGNENFINGQNVITIIVTNSDETEATTYQVYANKNMADPDELEKSFEEADIKYQIKFWSVRILIVLIFILLIILFNLISKKVKSRKETNQNKIKKTLDKKRKIKTK